MGADKMSAIVDYSDRTTCILFGDAAAAVLLEPNHEGYGILDSLLKSDGSGCQLFAHESRWFIKTCHRMKPLQPKNILFTRKASLFLSLQ